MHVLLIERFVDNILQDACQCVGDALLKVALATDGCLLIKLVVKVL